MTAPDATLQAENARLRADAVPFDVLTAIGIVDIVRAYMNGDIRTNRDLMNALNQVAYARAALNAPDKQEK